MGKYLVVGRAGSGKSTVTRELKRRGYTAFDADEVKNLSCWLDSVTNEVVEFTDNSYVDRSRYGWFWEQSIVHDLLRQYDDFFLCGGAENDLELADGFDAVFVLWASHPSRRADQDGRRSDRGLPA